MVRCVENTGGRSLHAEAFFKVPVLHLDRPLDLEIEHAAASTERLAVEIYDSREPAGYRRLGLLSEQDGQSWRVDHFAIALDMLTAQSARSRGAASVEGASVTSEQDETHHSEPEIQHPRRISARDGASMSLVADERANELDAGEAHPPNQHESPIKRKSQPSYQDKWNTSEAEFVEVTPWGQVDSRSQYVFALGETVTFRIVTDVRMSLPVLWLAASFYDQFGSRVFVTVQKFTGGAAPGRHEINLTLTRLNLRQGEYAGTFELLPEFDFNWRGAGRLPYLCLWDRCVFFKIDEGYRGVIELGLMEVASTATSPTLAIAEPVAAVATDNKLDRPSPVLVTAGRS